MNLCSQVKCLDQIDICFSSKQLLTECAIKTCPDLILIFRSNRACAKVLQIKESSGKLFFLLLFSTQPFLLSLMFRCDLNESLTTFTL